jgi:hypothetical protein
VADVGFLASRASLDSGAVQGCWSRPGEDGEATRYRARVGLPGACGQRRKVNRSSKRVS